MGATLKVKNLGPIIDAELDIKKTTVFIGPQGSGKSTLAKLVAITVMHEPLDTNTFKFYGLPSSYLRNSCYAKALAFKIDSSLNATFKSVGKFLF